MAPLDALLIYPQLGSLDDLLRDIPISLIYAATHSVKKGYRVKILDLRLCGDQWRPLVDEHLKDGCRLVGLSVMTGNPIRTSLEISGYIKERHGLPVVWGGPHPTMLPEQTLAHPHVDYVVRDWGSLALCQLLDHLHGTGQRREDILGLGYKEDGRIELSPSQTCFEMLDFRDLPYHLVDISGDNYNRLSNGQLIFPIFTAMGCPYQCTFCMSPAMYQKIRGKKWVHYGADEVLDHIEHLAGRYDFNRLQFYDDDSFVDLERMRDLLARFVERGYHRKYKLDFRGARINELDRMDDDYLRLMVEAGVELLMIGVESGSDRVLKLMQKGTSVEQIIRVNQKLARFPALQPNYNFFSGIPGETLEDLIQTKDLLWRLVQDHPGCYLGFGSYWKPMPGSVLAERAVSDFAYRLPQSLEEWIAVDSYEANALDYPWITPAMHRMIGLLQVVGALKDAKAKNMHLTLGPVLGRALYALVLLYRPLLDLRLRHNFTGLLVEPALRDFALRNFGRLLASNRKGSRQAQAVKGLS